MPYFAIAIIMLAADNIYTRIVFKNGAVQEYSLFMTSLLTLLMFVNSWDVLLIALMVGVVSSLLHFRLPIYKRVFNAVNYSLSCSMSVFAYIATTLFLSNDISGEPSGGLATKVIALVAAGIVYEVTGELSFCLVAQQGVSMKEWVSTLILPFGSTIVSVWISLMFVHFPSLIILAMAGVIAFLKPRYHFGEPSVDTSAVT
jgi:hypothetical protein